MLWVIGKLTLSRFALRRILPGYARPFVPGLLLLVLLPASVPAQEVLVNDDTIGGVIQTACAVAAAGGRVTVVWEDYRRNDYDPNIYCQQFDSLGNRLDTNLVVNEDTASRIYQRYRQRSPAVAVKTNGALLICWEDYRFGDPQVYYQLMSANARPLGRNKRIGPDFAPRTQPSVTSLGNSYLLAWEQTETGSRHRIYCALVDSTGTCGTPFVASDNSEPEDCAQPAVAAWSDRFVIAWRQVGTPNIIRARWFARNGTPVGPSRAVGQTDGSRPRLACSPQGQGMLVWQYAIYPQQHVWAQVFDSAGTWLTPALQVNQPASSYSGHPDVAFDSAQNRFAVVWHDNRLGSPQIYLQSYDLQGTPLGTNSVVAPSPGLAAQTAPSLTVCGIGQIAVFWEDMRGNNPDIYGFLSEVTAQAFRVNSDRASAIQDFPVIVLGKEGYGAIFWYDYRRSPTLPGLYSQLFKPGLELFGGNTGAWSDSNAAAMLPWATANPAGNTIVAWQDHRNGNSDIYAGTLYVGPPLFDPPAINIFRVNDDSGATAQTWPFVAINGTGHYVVVWSDARHNVSAPYAQLMDWDGRRIGPNQRIAYSGREPSAWISEQGDIWVSWITSTGIRVRHYDSLFVPLDTALHITEGDAGTWAAPKLNGTSLNSVWLVWMDRRRGEWEVYGQKLNSSGQPDGANFRVNDDRVLCEHCFPWIAYDGRDRFYVTWTDFRLVGNLDVRCQILDTSGVVRDSSFIVNTDPWPGVHQWAYGSVAARGDDVVFTWIDNRNLRSWDVYARAGLPVIPERRWWQALDVQPTVTSGAVQIRAKIPLQGTGELEIVDIVGRIRLKIPGLAIPEIGSAVPLDVSSLPDGAYFVRFRFRSLVLVGRLIKVP